jgi:magnesium chelatase family protein
VTVARAFSAAVVGLDAQTVVVETAIGAGLPGLTIVGLADMAVKESRERLRSALRHVGFPLPGKNVVVNLAPADLPKAGTALDLAAALSILAANGDIPAEGLSGVTLLGELALDGALRPVPGVLAVAETSRKDGRSELLVPPENAAEAAALGDVIVRSVPHLGAAIAHFSGREMLPVVRDGGSKAPAGVEHEFDLSEVRGQGLARRALEIAAAGGHNMLMSGPPGAGKTMLARRLPGLLPPLSREEALEVTRIWSVAGRLPAGSGLLWRRPFRSPHHGASAPALAGGGADPKPGELSLAHFGVLFLDELPEFRRDALEALREPLEDGVVSVARAAGSRSFPARFLLVAAMNPCPCGFRGDPRHTCRCTERDVGRYRRKISGPLLDRIDLHVEVPAVAAADFGVTGEGESSSSVRERVVAARDRQQARTGDPRLVNGSLSGRTLKRDAKPSEPARRFLERALDRLGLSARSYHRVLRVALTIADLEGTEGIHESHVAEALRYRPSPASPT